jgi:hypothetical protein
MLRAHRLWATQTALDNELRGVHTGRSWGEGIVQAYCHRCQDLAGEQCIKQHGAGLYACMDESHVDYYESLVRVHGPTIKGAVWCWGAMRHDGMHVWAQYALPEAMMNAACKPHTVADAVHHS